MKSVDVVVYTTSKEDVNKLFSLLSHVVSGKNVEKLGFSSVSLKVDIFSI